LPATDFQRRICRAIAENRIENGESYVAGGTALNTILRSPRLSADIDLFHDAGDAVVASYRADRNVLERLGYSIQLKAELPSFIECIVSTDSDSVILQWLHDSAFRFFPLQTHPDFGLTLHPFDLATNKVLALVGRLAVRDWFDVIQCHSLLQPLGYLAWAAAGKDPGLSPAFIVDQAHRSGRYTQIEVDTLIFEEQTPNARELALEWKQMLRDAADIVEVLPARHIGACLLDTEGNLLTAPLSELTRLMKADAIIYHQGCLRGAYPVVKPS